MYEMVIADYTNTQHRKDILWLLNAYAEDPMGGNTPLSSYTQKNLLDTLATLPYAFSVICYHNNKPVGLANCFEGFSTFNCKPLINIHDIAVISEYRRQGISQKLLGSIETVATSKGCCKITLEVLEGNHAAQDAYKKYGFDAYELDPTMGTALFWQKKL